MKISDIAKVAGVSPGTVSNALNNRKGISQEKKDMILKIAREMGYTKESEESSNIIRFIIFKRHGHVVSDTPFFTALIEGIERECRAQGYELLISHIIQGEHTNEEIEKIIKQDKVSGILLLATEMLKEDLVNFRELNVPIVLLDSYFNNEDFDYVLMNNAKGAYMATSHLIKNGHMRIGYLCSSIYINNFYYRKTGYLEALKDNDIRIEDELFYSLESTLDGSYRDMKRYLEAKEHDMPTAFFADNDIIAFGAMRALIEKGIKIPEEVSIVGFDDMPFCEISNPRLTTVKVHKQDIGRTAVKRLLEKISDEEDVRQKIEIDTELVIRESVFNKNY